MRRDSLLIAAALSMFLTACGGEDGPDAGLLQQPQAIEARFVQGRSVNVITVTTVDPLALRSAVLTGPGGVAAPAYSIDTTPAPGEAATPAGGAFPPTPGMPLTRTTVNTILSTALIELPDPVRYVHDWRQYRIHLRLANPGGQSRELVLAAPAPPRDEGG